MNKCGDCIHYDICQPYVEKDESFPEIKGGCRCFKNKADFNKTIDNLITEIHCLEAKCRKYEEEIARLKIIIKEMSEEDI